MKQVNGTRAQSFSVCGGEVCGPGDGSVHVRRHVEQSTTRKEMFEPCQRGISFARDMLAFAGGNRAPLVKRTLEDGVSHFQCVQGEKKELGGTEAAILSNGFG